MNFLFHNDYYFKLLVTRILITDGTDSNHECARIAITDGTDTGMPVRIIFFCSLALLGF